MLKGKNEETCWPSQPKIQKPNTNENHDLERRDLLDSDILEWLQEFRENLVDDRVPEHRDSHASSSHEPSSERKPARSADLGKHSVCTHFTKKTEIARSSRGPKLQEPRAEDAMRDLFHNRKNFGDLITADHKVLSEGCESRNNHRCAVVVQDLATQWIQSYPCKTKTSQETQRSLQKFLEPNRKPKVIYTDNSLEFGKVCEDLSWNHCTSTPHRSGTNGIEWKKVPLQYCCNQVWMKIGGQIPWNVIPICETFKISCLMGKLHTRGVSENHLKDQSFRSVHWLSITLFLRKTSRESINLERQSYLDCSLGMLCTRSEFGRVTYWLQTLRSWKRWTHQKSTPKDSMKGK